MFSIWYKFPLRILIVQIGTEFIGIVFLSGKTVGIGGVYKDFRGLHSEAYS